MIEWIILGLFVICAVWVIFSPQRGNLVAISGLSGSGKTTIGKKLAKEHGAKFIDLDKYFVPKENIPRTKLSNGEYVTNYDCYEAINWQKFWEDVDKSLYKYELVVIVGYCLPITEEQFFITYGEDRDYDYHFHLHLKLDKEECKKRRVASKGLTGDKIEKDGLEVDEIVWPFYKQNYYHSGDLNYRHIDEVVDATKSPNIVFEHISGILFSLGYIN